MPSRLSDTQRAPTREELETVGEEVRSAIDSHGTTNSVWGDEWGKEAYSEASMSAHAGAISARHALIIAIAKRMREAEARWKEAARKIEHLVPYYADIEEDSDGDPTLSFLHDESEGEWLHREQVVAILNAAEETRAVEAEADDVGMAIIAAERRGQVEREGYTTEHDDTHTDEEMASCAACYAMPAECRQVDDGGVPIWWPFGCCDWKPTPHDRVRELAKAGALIAAEIGHLKRRAAGGPHV